MVKNDVSVSFYSASNLERVSFHWLLRKCYHWEWTHWILFCFVLLCFFVIVVVVVVSRSSLLKGENTPHALEGGRLWDDSHRLLANNCLPTHLLLLPFPSPPVPKRSRFFFFLEITVNCLLLDVCTKKKKKKKEFVSENKKQITTPPKKILFKVSSVCALVIGHQWRKGQAGIGTSPSRVL